MKVSHVLDSLARGCRKLLVPLAAFLLLVLLLKQLQLYDWIVDIYKSCLPVLMGIVIAFLLQPLIDRLQLQHAIERAVILSESNWLRPEDFILRSVPLRDKEPSDELNLTVLEKEAIERALRRAEGNITRAAELLGITRFTLYRKLEKFGL